MTIQVHTHRLSDATAAAVIFAAVNDVSRKNGLRWHLTSNVRADDYVMGSNPRRMSLHSESENGLAWDFQFQVRVRIDGELKYRWCTDDEHKSIGKRVKEIIGSGFDHLTHKSPGDKRVHCHFEYDP